MHFIDHCTLKSVTSVFSSFSFSFLFCFLWERTLFIINLVERSIDLESFRPTDKRRDSFVSPFLNPILLPPSFVAVRSFFVSVFFLKYLFLRLVPAVYRLLSQSPASAHILVPPSPIFSFFSRRLYFWLEKCTKSIPRNGQKALFFLLVLCRHEIADFYVDLYIFRHTDERNGIWIKNYNILCSKYHRKY